VECTADETFLVERLPQLVSDVLARLRGEEPAPPEEPPPPPVEPAPKVHVTGEVLDYWSNVPVARANVQLGDLVATSDDGGRYLLEGQYAFSEGTVTVSASGYRATNTPIQLPGRPTTHVASIASVADLQRQLATLGVIEKQGANSVVIVDLVDSVGNPVEGVPAADLTLMIPGRGPDGFGPVFFGPDGDVRSQSELPSSTVFDGRARAAFFNAGNGTRFVQVYTALGGSVLQGVTPVEPREDVSICRLVLQTT
jgi:hypothetical protein